MQIKLLRLAEQDVEQAGIHAAIRGATAGQGGTSVAGARRSAFATTARELNDMSIAASGGHVARSFGDGRQRAGGGI